MQRFMMKSKIHRATVTDADLHYEGSVTIDETLMEAANMLPYEQVEIYDINNGERFSTYIIQGKRDSGVICLNGAAARKVAKGDLIIMATYVSVNDDEAKNWKPISILVDAKNKIKKASK
jgi:aspartate 1-decarboxylase